MGIGDWGLGIGDWGLGPIPNPQSPDLYNNIKIRYIKFNFVIFIKIYLNDKYLLKNGNK